MAARKAIRRGCSYSSAEQKSESATRCRMLPGAAVRAKTYAEKLAPLSSSAGSPLLLGLLAMQMQGGVERHKQRGNLSLSRIRRFQRPHIGSLSEVSVFRLSTLLGFIVSPSIEQVAGEGFIILRATDATAAAAGLFRLRCRHDCDSLQADRKMPSERCNGLDAILDGIAFSLGNGAAS